MDIVQETKIHNLFIAPSTILQTSWITVNGRLGIWINSLQKKKCNSPLLDTSMSLKR
jgi:hypothetical protein